MGRLRAAFGSAVFFVVAPGMVAGAIPWWIARSSTIRLDWPVQSFGVLITLVASAVLLRCFIDFVIALGTPAPFAPTQNLVVAGSYRHVRNPMYMAVVGIIFGQALLSGSGWVALYGLLVWVTTAAFVRYHEEPALRRRFGPHYLAYQEAVRRWLPRFRPWRG